MIWVPIRMDRWHQPGVTTTQHHKIPFQCGLDPPAPSQEPSHYFPRTLQILPETFPEPSRNLPSTIPNPSQILPDPSQNLPRTFQNLPEPSYTECPDSKPLLPFISFISFPGSPPHIPWPSSIGFPRGEGCPEEGAAGVQLARLESGVLPGGMGG